MKFGPTSLPAGNKNRDKTILMYVFLKYSCKQQEPWCAPCTSCSRWRSCPGPGRAPFCGPSAWGRRSPGRCRPCRHRPAPPASRGTAGSSRTTLQQTKQLRPNPHWIRALKFAGNSFDVACVDCELYHSQQKVPVAFAHSIAWHRVQCGLGLANPSGFAWRI